MDGTRIDFFPLKQYLFDQVKLLVGSVWISEVFVVFFGLLEIIMGQLVFMSVMSSAHDGTVGHSSAIRTRWVELYIWLRIWSVHQGSKRGGVCFLLKRIQYTCGTC